MQLHAVDPATLEGQPARVAAAVLGQPFTRLVGLEISEIREGYLEAFLENRPELSQQNGFIHGGVVGYMADNTAAGVAGTMMPDGATGSVTAEYKINILRPAVGDVAIARASVIRRGRNQCVVESRVSCFANGEEKLVAVALATISYIYPAAAA